MKKLVLFLFVALFLSAGAIFVPGLFVTGCGGGGGCASSANNFTNSLATVSYNASGVSSFSDAPSVTDAGSGVVNFSCAGGCDSGDTGGSGVSVSVTCIGSGAFSRTLTCIDGEIRAVIGSATRGCVAGTITCTSTGSNQVDVCDDPL